MHATHNNLQSTSLFFYCTLCMMTMVTFRSDIPRFGLLIGLHVLGLTTASFGVLQPIQVPVYGPPGSEQQWATGHPVSGPRGSQDAAATDNPPFNYDYPVKPTATESDKPEQKPLL